MPPKKKVKLNESPEINLIWTDDLLLESVRNFKTQNACRSPKLFDPTTCCFSIFLCRMQNHFFVLPKLRMSLA